MQGGEVVAGEERPHAVDGEADAEQRRQREPGVREDDESRRATPMTIISMKPTSRR
jgi:hypothetical protein